MLLGTLSASLLGNFLTGKGVKATSQGRGIYRVGKGKGINRAGEGAIVTTQSREIVRAGHGNNKIDF